MESHAVLVLGMHRCGTSALTRCLGFLGADLGSELVEPAGDNPTGFWEDIRFLAINQRLTDLLGEEGDRWWEHSVPPEIPLSSPGVRSLMSEAVEEIRGRFAASAWWSFKDPRTLRAFPFWEEALVQAGVQIMEVIVVRHPLACAQSLLRRNDIPEERSVLLWAGQYLAHWPRVAARPFVAVDYDRVLEEPKRELRRLSDRLGLPWREAAAEEARRFLRADLRHTRFAAEDLKHRPDISPLVVETFEALEDLCVDRDLQSASARMVSLHAEFSRAIPVLRALDSEIARTVRRSHELSALQREVSALRKRMEASRTWQFLLRLQGMERAARGLRKRLLGSRADGSE
ncbi:protein of unknown function [Methylacidimicrobium sp. AP8]|uniref:sulfotransferase family protein n=1 Tax=Methylacidimicrobium sp. AP8 TaxID=2730359 RepID=UPI0018C05F22|nr:sulfotransferase [Methylacidimicrobium sp. AP8]CAB4242792.1 protein of unknown function [Methylacidimicrobium sp. AP8]